MQRFIDASKAGDYEKIKACLSQSFLDKMSRMPGGEEAMKNGLKQSAGQNSGGTVGKTTYENDGATAVVEVKPDDKAQLPPGMTGVEMVLIKEEGQWKIDLETTGKRMIKKMFPNGIPGMPGS